MNWKSIWRPVVTPFGPFVKSLRDGHLRSCLTGVSVDECGAPLPWYTRSAIDYLNTIDVAGKSILEFGGGQSTIWWACRGARVVCVETNAAWVTRCKRLLKKYECQANAEFILASTGLPDGEPPLDRIYDIIVVDDGTGDGPLGRVRNFGLALNHCAPGGLIIVDNAQAWHGLQALTDAVREQDLVIDFIGIAPGGFRPYCTAILFRGRRPWGGTNR